MFPLSLSSFLISLTKWCNYDENIIFLQGFPLNILLNSLNSLKVIKPLTSHTHTHTGRKQPNKEKQAAFLSCWNKGLHQKEETVMQREKEQESIKRCQRGWARPHPRADWNNECVPRGHLPPIPNGNGTFWDQRVQHGAVCLVFFF